MAQTLSTAAAAGIVAEICLYGTRHVGAGWLARTADASVLLGDGELVADRGESAAIWEAVDAIRAAGVTSGLAMVLSAGCRAKAIVDLGQHVPNAGNLNWVVL